MNLNTPIPPSELPLKCSNKVAPPKEPSINLSLLIQVYYYMSQEEGLSHLSDYELSKKRIKTCITCRHFRYTTDAHCQALLTCPFHEKLIPQGNHLIKGCQYWKKDLRVFAPEAA